jgi:Fur family zinc uptake transcriptional regulator
MRPKNSDLSPHSQSVLALLQRSDRPMTAYEILGALHGSGIKAPPTVYRALENLMSRGNVHRIESINAFVACHEGGSHSHGHHGHPAQFAVCQSCGGAEEIHDERLTPLLSELAGRIGFSVSRQVLELSGTCHSCLSAALEKRA